MNVDALLAWYQENKRDLPFRKTRDPYRIWISEIMAQQTRISAMLGYYERFMDRFPTLAALAAADENLLLKTWQGLGYYSRARNLQKAARICVKQYGGRLPETYEELRQLPGIGEYTAGAIASIAYGKRVPAIDGNVIRVYSRLHWRVFDVSKAAGKKELKALVEADLPSSKQMPQFTQALMELGAMACTPKKADCARCPLQPECQGAKQPDPALYPLKQEKKPRPVETFDVIVQAAWQKGQWHLLVHRRPDKGLLAGLYEFGSVRPDVAYEEVSLGEHHHIFTHREWKMKGTLVITDWNPAFIPLEDIAHTAAIPSAFAPFYERTVRYFYGS